MLLYVVHVSVRPTEIPECDVFVCESRVEGKGLTSEFLLLAEL